MAITLKGRTVTFTGRHARDLLAIAKRSGKTPKQIAIEAVKLLLYLAKNKKG